jgi:hypothetical protein
MLAAARPGEPLPNVRLSTRGLSSLSLELSLTIAYVWVRRLFTMISRYEFTRLCAGDMQQLCPCNLHAPIQNQSLSLGVMSIEIVLQTMLQYILPTHHDGLIDAGSFTNNTNVLMNIRRRLWFSNYPLACPKSCKLLFLSATVTSSCMKSIPVSRAGFKV